MAGNDGNVKLLVHCDGADESTTFTDESVGGGGHVITANGDAQVDTDIADPFGGNNGTLLVDGTGDYLSVLDSDDWYFGTGDFSIEARVRLSGVGSNQTFISQGTGSYNYWAFGYNSVNGLRFTSDYGQIEINEGEQGEGKSEWLVDTWYHCLVVRDGNNFYLFKDGALVASTTDSDAVSQHSSIMVIGCLWKGSASEYTAGNIDEVRIVKGSVCIKDPNDPLYIPGDPADGFSPPTAPYSVLPINQKSRKAIPINRIPPHALVW